jgi:O-antigen/teichoic acid export membrane protein
MILQKLIRNNHSQNLSEMKLQDRHDTLLINSGFLFAFLLVGPITGYFFWVITTRSFQADEVGLGAGMLSVSHMLSGIAGLGIGAGLIRFLPFHPNPKSLLNGSITFTFISSTVICLLFIFGTGIWSPSFVFLRENYLLAAGLIGFVSILCINTLLLMVFQAYRVSQFALSQTLLFNALRLGMIFIFIQQGAFGIVASAALATMISATIGIYVCLPRLVEQYKFGLEWPGSPFRQIIPFSLGSSLADLLYRAPLLCLPVIILEILGPESGAVAYIGWFLGWMVSSPGQAISSAFFAEGAYSPTNLQQLYTKATKNGVFSTVIISIITILFAPWALNLFGRNYASATSLLRWLALAAPFMTINIHHFTRLRLENKVFNLVTLTSLSAFIAIIIPVASINIFGLTSTGIGWFIAQVMVSSIIILNSLKKPAQSLPSLTASE